MATLFKIGSMENLEKEVVVGEKKSFTDTVGTAFTSVGSGVKKSVSGTMDWVRNFFFKIWGMVLLSVLAIGALIVMLAFAVSILDGTTSFKRLCGEQSIVACVSGVPDATAEEKKEIIEATGQSSPTQRSAEAEQVKSEKDLNIENNTDVAAEVTVEEATEVLEAE